MHVLFLKEKMPKDKQELVLAALPEKERCVFRGREVYCSPADGRRREPARPRPRREKGKGAGHRPQLAYGREARGPLIAIQPSSARDDITFSFSGKRAIDLLGTSGIEEREAVRK